ncbi:MAG: high-potential iron-sulfur protein [Xanthomonadales bacterium]|nr:high-potential iron-sulfur protein [Xanthomonadales bacterium]
MDNTSNPNRRKFLKTVAGSATIVPVVLAGGTGSAFGQDLPKLAADDPTAVALGYVEDTANADKAKFPNHSPDQKCENCQLILGADGADWRPCSIFPGKSVAKDGWCSAWVKKAG